jgi:3-oxoacyl-[acyl-carrier-protein] synthase-3
MATSKNHPAQSGTGIYAHIVGWGMAVPELIMTNHDLAAIVETDDEWIQSRTGIRERRIANDKESTATLAYKAAQQALEVANVLPTDIDLIVVATSTPEHVFPSTASLVQDWLGASKAGAFDLSAACSGFVYSVNMAAQAIRTGTVRTAIIIGAETMSRIVDWQDRNTCVLFGDGAGAVVLRASYQPGGVLASVLRSDGSGADVLSLATPNARDANEHRIGKMFMVGSEVFKFATRVVDESIRESVALAGITLEDIDLIVPHQANQRILQTAAKKLNIPIERFMSNVERYGNTSAASIPIALVEAIQQGRIKQDDHIVMVGFGAGLTWASMVVQWGIPDDAGQVVSPLNRPRRQISYVLAYWRTRFSRWRRALAKLFRFITRKGAETLSQAERPNDNKR